MKSYLVYYLAILFHVLLYTNINAQWTKLDSVGTDLRDVQFFNLYSGFVLSGGPYTDGSIHKTTDGGKHWTETNFSNSLFWNMHFLNDQIGWICGYSSNEGDGSIWRTTNGGQSWSENIILDNSYDVWDVFFNNANLGWAVGGGSQGYLGKSTDGGISWTQIPLPMSVNQRIRKIFFLNENTGWAVGNGGYVIGTTDGGINWSVLVDYQFGLTDWMGLYFINEQNGWAVGWHVGSSGTIGRTTNGGTSWTVTDAPDLYNIQFIDDDRGWIVGAGMFITTDGGTTWNSEDFGASTLLKAVHFPVVQNNTLGWAVGTNGTVLVRENLIPYFIGVNTSYSFGDFKQTSSYRIIGIPGNDDLPIGNFIPGSSGKENDWRAFRDPGSGNYIEYPNGTFNFGKGRAFWVLSKQAFSISETVGTGILKDNTYSIQVDSGWNLITNPFKTTIRWQAVIDTNAGVTESIHYYQSGSYSESSQFEYYKGYYFYNNPDLLMDSLKIPYIVPGESPLQKQQIGISKELEIELFSDGEIKSAIAIGFSEEAKAGVDKLDKFSPPSNFCELNLALYNEELETNYKYLQKDYREKIGEGQEFEIKLKNTTGKNIELKVEGIEDFTEYELYLLDNRLNKLYNLKEQNIVEVKRTVRDGDYSLLVGTESYISDKKSNLLPEDYVLYQNYPNPFNPITTIRFSIPKDEIITLSVYNILGELVKEVIKTQQYEAGYYEVELDGSSLSSGVYIYKLEAGSFIETKKMVLLR